MGGCASRPKDFESVEEAPIPVQSPTTTETETKAVPNDAPVQDKENVEEPEKKEQPLDDADEANEEEDKKESNATEEAAPITETEMTEAMPEPESAVQEEKKEAAKE